MKTATSTMFTTAQRRFALIAAALAFLAIPAISRAQGVFNGMAGGAAEGSYRGNRAAGPVGGVVGGAVGLGVGAVNGVLGVRPGYHRHHRRGYYRNGRYYRRY